MIGFELDEDAICERCWVKKYKEAIEGHEVYTGCVEISGMDFVGLLWEMHDVDNFLQRRKLVMSQQKLAWARSRHVWLHVYECSLT